MSMIKSQKNAPSMVSFIQMKRYIFRGNIHTKSTMTRKKMMKIISMKIRTVLPVGEKGKFIYTVIKC